MQFLLRGLGNILWNIRLLVATLCRSLVFHDFVAKCLTKEPRLRPTAAEMLKHKFVERCKTGASAMSPKIEKSRQIRATMALQAQSVVAPSLEDTVCIVFLKRLPLS
jgi:serine/threonine protein kinase